MIRRLLIANRGEIAVRIARTAREMGIEDVAVYSEADAGAFHVGQMAGAVSLGPGEPRETYLSVPRLIEAARRAKADGVHPGYGFLSENADFARAVDQAGLVWVGPSPEAIEQMGDKVRSRAKMREAGVPVVPGSDPKAATDAELAAEAGRIGFPVLVKAAAGGGGKGMSRVDRAEDLPAALAEARRVAASAFGDERVYLEKLLERPHHVEFQIFGDRAGHLIHLFERECSVQRRHQKIVEETPSPALEGALRSRMAEAAVEAGRAVGYVGAGTVELLLDEKRNFYFLEMNTRLQVEHPITEVTLGIDLVRAQLEVAAGRTLPDHWARLTPRGHAIELRLYAEDPVTSLPRSGEIVEYAEPAGPGVRVDSGIASQLARRPGVRPSPRKARRVGAGPQGGDRTRAAGTRGMGGAGGRDQPGDARGRAALSGVPVRPLRDGPRLAPSRSRSAGTALGGLDRRGARVRVGAGGTLSSLFRRRRRRTRSLGRIFRLEDRGVRIESGGRVRDVRLSAEAASLDGERHVVRVEGEGAAGEVLEIDGTRHRVRAVRRGDRVFVWCDGDVFEFAPARKESSAPGDHEDLRAPMPGRIRKVHVAEGESVSKGQVLLVLEAMKMEHAIRAPRDAAVRRLPHREGDLVEMGAPLIELS